MSERKRPSTIRISNLARKLEVIETMVSHFAPEAKEGAMIVIATLRKEYGLDQDT
jgi:hypothetical protein